MTDLLCCLIFSRVNVLIATGLVVADRMLPAKSGRLDDPSAMTLLAAVVAFLAAALLLAGLVTHYHATAGVPS